MITKDGDRLNFSSVAADGCIKIYVQGDRFGKSVLIC
jgi:hypothetical protein